MKNTPDTIPAATAPADLGGPPAAARAAGLRYVTDRSPGLRRVPGPDAPRYLDPHDAPVTEPDTLARIRALAIPPAWTDVWICKWPNGHLQATGRDARGRKQYRYHRRWRNVRDEVKYERMLSFGRALPAIRQAVDRALRQGGLPREKVLATIVYLLQATTMRIGNEAYARANKSFGLTTLRNRHVRVDGSEVAFRFRGKSGVFHDVKVSDRRLARIIGRLRDLPGQEVFQYLDDAGVTHSVDSADVNDYLRQITGEDYTAKDFRTWAGTVLAALALEEYAHFDSTAEARRNIVRAIEQVAGKLGNTPSICRKCYVHPAVLEAYLDGVLVEGWRTCAEDEPGSEVHALEPEEAAVLALLQQRLHSAAAATRPAARVTVRGAGGSKARPATGAARARP